MDEAMVTLNRITIPDAMTVIIANIAGLLSCFTVLSFWILLTFSYMSKDFLPGFAAIQLKEIKYAVLMYG